MSLIDTSVQASPIFNEEKQAPPAEILPQANRCACYALNYRLLRSPHQFL